MRLVSYAGPEGPRPGAVRNRRVIDLGSVAASILELIEVGEDSLAEADALAREADGVPIEAVSLLAPIPHPRGHLYCVGWNYPRHYSEGIGKRAGQENDERAFPAFFTKPPDAVVGPGAAVIWDADITEELDYEAELALVIGRTGRSIPEETALSYVMGFTLANDISARDIQRRHGGQWLKGKGMDTYCPMGPALVTRAEVPDIGRLRLRSRVNGEPRQDESVGNMIFPVERIIAELSLGMTLHPGDIVLTGTPAGTGFALDPASFLAPGDVVEVEIDEIGTLENRVREGSLRGEGGELAPAECLTQR